MFLGLSTAGWGAIILLIGVLGLVLKVKFAQQIARWNPLLPVNTTLLVLCIIGGLLGGVMLIVGIVTGLAEKAEIITPDVEELPETTGQVNVLLSGGLANSTSTEDHYNDAKDFLTFYSADANIEDAQDYSFNATIERSLIAEDANVKVTCTVPDKELSGITDDNLIDKDSGQIDLVFGGDATSTGSYTDDNTVWTYVAFAEGAGSKVVTHTLEHVEAYHDGMEDYDDYVNINCNADGVPYTARIYSAG